jgi:hypothetical protein
MRRTGCRQPGVHLVEAAARPNGGESGREVVLVGGREVHVARRHDPESACRGDRGEGVVDGAVERAALVEQLDEHVGPAEPVDETVDLGRGIPLAVAAIDARGGEGGAHRTLAAAGEDRPLATGAVGELVEVVERAPLLVAGQLAAREGGREPVISALLAREHHEVRALGVGDAVLRRAQAEGELGAEDGRDGCRVVDLRRARGLGEAHDAVETVVVGEGQSVQAEPVGLLDEVLGGGGAVEEAEVGVGVQLGIGHAPGVCRALDLRGEIGVPFRRPRGAVAAVGSRGRRARSRGIRELAFEFRPRNRGIVPRHQQCLAISRTSPRPPSARRGRGRRTRAARRCPSRRPPGTGSRAGSSSRPTSARRWSTGRPMP